MTFIIENWYLMVASIAMGTVMGCLIYKYVKLPSDKQLDKVRKWLLYAVIVAENKFGKKTGQIKLRVVYDMFVTKFPAIANILSFEVFSRMVDDALDEMKVLLKSDKAIKSIVDDQSSNL